MCQMLRTFSNMFQTYSLLPSSGQVVAQSSSSTQGGSKSVQRRPPADEVHTPVPCLFLCGECSASKDPVARLKRKDVPEDKLPYIRWGRGKDEDRYSLEIDKKDVQSCWYCERTFKAMKNELGSRKECQTDFASDQNKSKPFMYKRKELITNRVWAGHWKPTGVIYNSRTVPLVDLGISFSDGLILLFFV